MFDAIPVPVQAILWPLVGAVVILGASRLLPHWLGRLLASAAALVSFATLGSLRGSDAPRWELLWEPLGFFRTTPTIQPDDLALFASLVLTGVASAAAVGLRDVGGRRSAWHGLLLVALAGSLIAIMGINLPTVALGSGLIDLALIAMAATETGSESRFDSPLMGMIATGVLSTLMLTFGALHLSAHLGTTSFQAAENSIPVLVIVGMAGLLRLMIFPLHPRKLRTPQHAATLLLLVGVGTYLLARTQAIAPVLTELSWIKLLGSLALLAGGILAWAAWSPKASSEAKSVPAAAQGEPARDTDEPVHRLWLGLVVQQTGFAVVFSCLWAAVVPWPLVSATLSLAMLAIWWGTIIPQQAAPRPRWFPWAAEQWNSARERAKSYLAERSTALGRWQSLPLYRVGAAVLPTLAMASLAGLPLTAGAVARWPLYAAALDTGPATVVIILLAADTFLVASLWTPLSLSWRQVRGRRPSLPSVLSMTGLALLLAVVGFAPGKLPLSLGLAPAEPADASKLGIGLAFILPWLAGVWLARARTRVVEHLHTIWNLICADWLYRALGRIAQRLLGLLQWFALVGEGDGWWGWALVILAVGAVLLAIR